MPKLYLCYVVALDAKTLNVLLMDIHTPICIVSSCLCIGRSYTFLFYML